MHHTTTLPSLTAAPLDLSEHLLVSGTDVFALGHYPGNPIYPGVLLAEHLMQLAGRLATQVWGEPATVASIKRIQYLDAVLPGDVVTLTVSTKDTSADGLQVAAQARVGDKVKARATFLCRAGTRVCADPGTPSPPVRGAGAIDHRGLGGVLPHRYPFLLIDTIDEHQPGQWLRATKLVNRASPLFLSAMPTHWPHGLVIEAIGQAGIALFFLSRTAHPAADIVLGAIGDTTLCHDLPFGAVLTVEARIERMLDKSVIFSGQARLGEQVILRVGSLVAMVDPR